MFYIADRYGFVSEFYRTVENGFHVHKLKHCLDVREAMPFTDAGVAERAYRSTVMGNLYYAILQTT